MQWFILSTGIVSIAPFLAGHVQPADKLREVYNAEAETGKADETKNVFFGLALEERKKSLLCGSSVAALRMEHASLVKTLPRKGRIGTL